MKIVWTEEKFTKAKELKAKGFTMITEADETTSGPASFVIVDPDGNPILVDQHV